MMPYFKQKEKNNVFIKVEIFSTLNQLRPQPHLYSCLFACTGKYDVKQCLHCIKCTCKSHSIFLKFDYSMISSNSKSSSRTQKSQFAESISAQLFVSYFPKKSTWLNSCVLKRKFLTHFSLRFTFKACHATQILNAWDKDEISQPTYWS